MHNRGRDTVSEVVICGNVKGPLYGNDRIETPFPHANRDERERGADEGGVQEDHQCGNHHNDARRTGSCSTEFAPDGSGSG